MLWQAKLPKGQRMRLITVFASCILTSLVYRFHAISLTRMLKSIQVSLAHAYCIWVNKGLDEFFSAMFEVSSNTSAAAGI